MNKKKIRALIPPLISLLVSLASGIGMIYLYYPTKYLPFYLLGLTLLLPSLINVTLFLLKIPTAPRVRACEANPGEIKEHKDTRFRRVLQKIAVPFVFLFRLLKDKIDPEKAVRYISLLSAAAAFGAIQFFFGISLRAATSLYTVNYAYAVLLIALFLVYIVLDKWMLHNETDDEYATALTFNIRSTIAVARLALILIIPAVFIKLLGIYELQKYVVIAMAIIFYWSSLFILLSYLARAVRHELDTLPDIRIPAPFSGGSGNDIGIISYLEDNTGITMRGLWSVKLIKKLIVPSLVSVFLLLWLSTGIVEIGSGQNGALYNFGKLSDTPLEPGLHMTLPWPFGKTVIYNTDSVSSITIGYRSDTSSDNVWTQSHGSEEYELLLGGGEELVSINLCIEYKIGDLHAYLKNCAKPEAILEASAYELVADKTIVTDLDTLLSIDREQFASDFKIDLTEKISIRNTGIEIVSVVLESIHPPLGIADIYQRLVSAEIEASTRIMNARAAAVVRVLEAETQNNSMISYATAEKLAKIAAAEAEVAEFMASVAADKSYSNAYRYYKYLDAVGNAYGNANIILVGSDIDQSRIYLGSFKN
jgi:regulator of protease activity HflC (stomatin/prohibitin superfamily)